MKEFYEIHRDNFKYPSYWRDYNIACVPHFHGSIELLYVLDGSQKAVVDGRPYTVEKNQVLISSSYTIHSYVREKHCQSILLVVPLNFISSYSTVLSKKVFAQCVCKDGEVNKEILHCLEQLLVLGECGDSTSNIIKGYVMVILGLLIYKIGLTDVGEDNLLSKDIIKYLQNNYLSSVSLNRLAQDFGYSKYRFSHIFSAYFGCSLPEYVNSLRARHAANLLVETEAPLLEIAMNSGFESVRTFYRIFKHYFGMTPSQYRSNYIAKQRISETNAGVSAQ
jgi:AraC-like DNA-binding protein